SPSSRRRRTNYAPSCKPDACGFEPTGLAGFRLYRFFESPPSATNDQRENKVINGLARLTRREAVGATAIAGAAIALLFGAAGIARANTYGYSDIYNCYFLTGIFVNYTPVRLVIENSGTWRHIYRVQFGTVTGHSNSEKINQVSV